jgi:hypothetical protein
MPGPSPLSATEVQRAELKALARSRERGEADRARAVLLTLADWTSPRIAEAFGVREDTVRLWRIDFIDPALIILNHAAYRMDFWRKKLRTRAGDFDSRCM